MFAAYDRVGGEKSFELDSSGLPLGMFCDTNFVSSGVRPEAGETILLFTDGGPRRSIMKVRSSARTDCVGRSMGMQRDIRPSWCRGVWTRLRLFGMEQREMTI
ncbi:MAG: serine/threonine-protein phosphatase [Acidobacteria bacterium]|nr:serine/threonine-protein phosphatase [Acidobacteriota bacterium]